MKIGTVIRQYRKNLGMTQEEMANQLGVTTPAVNKWENGNTLPDITLLAPIARLLGITTDELLSFKEALTTKEIEHFVLQLQKELQEKDYATAFLSAKHKIEEYPNCYELILGITGVLHMQQQLLEKHIPNMENYKDIIIGWYERCLHSENEDVRDLAALALFDTYYYRKDYQMALHYTKYLSDKNTITCRKFMEAMVYSKTDRKNEAYKAYEELIFERYQSLAVTLSYLCMLYKEDNNHEMANNLVNISSAIAASFEMGRSHEIGHLGLEIAAWEKDVAKTEQIMRDSLNSIGTIMDFKKSSLYQHITFRDIGDDVEKAFKLDSESQRKRLVTSYKDEKFNYMRGNEWWEKLTSSADK